MNTIILNGNDEQSILLCVDEIQCGNLVSFPTETVYGLAADATSNDAVKKIFEVKGRDFNKPLSVQLADKKKISEYAEIQNDLEQKIIDHFMPGPLTLILKNKSFSPLVTGGKDTVGIRIPDHSVALTILEKVGIPLVVTSANLSGQPSPTTAEMVKQDLDGRISIIVDGGPCDLGIESTVVKVEDGRIVIVREGFVKREEIEKRIALG